MEEEKKVIRGYKGFDKNLRCRGFQYEVGKEYECDKAVICENGFHFCEKPLDVLKFYPPFLESGCSRYCEVEGSGEFNRSEKGDKLCCTKIKIIKELTLEELFDVSENNNGQIKDEIKIYFSDKSAAVNDCISSISANVGNYSSARNVGYHSISSNTGYRSFSTNVGDGSLAVNTGCNSLCHNTGYQSVAANSGVESASTNNGKRSVSANTGYKSLALTSDSKSISANTGHDSTAKCDENHSSATNIGNFSEAICNGDFSIASNNGPMSYAKSTGKNSVAITTGAYCFSTVTEQDSVSIVMGVGGMGKGALGSWLILTEYDEWNGESFPIKDIKAFKVDGETVKPDTFYKLIDGHPVEIFE